MFYNLKFVFGTKYQLYYNFGVRTILIHLHRCPKVKTDFATCPKLGHGREHDLGLRFVQRWS